MKIQISFLISVTVFFLFTTLKFPINIYELLDGWKVKEYRSFKQSPIGISSAYRFRKEKSPSINGPLHWEAKKSFLHTNAFSEVCTYNGIYTHLILYSCQRPIVWTRRVHWLNECPLPERGLTGLWTSRPTAQSDTAFENSN